jgi:hypothetical protein
MYYFSNKTPIDFPPMILDRGERIDVRNPVHLQRVTGVPGVLADFLHHGRPVFWRQVLQMPGRAGRQNKHNSAQIFYQIQSCYYIFYVPCRL